jgi:hypothetical protein
MLLSEFLDNPVGKGDAATNIKFIRQALDLKYATYIKDKKVEMKIFHQPMKDVYWIWLIMPSETERDNTYDIVFTFSNPKPTNRATLGIGKFDIQIFANTPSFAYTYAYVYAKNGLLIPSLSSKLGKVFMSKAPDTRNRNQVLLFDKYIYMGARYILDSKILNRTIADTKSRKYDEKLVNAKIRSLNTIMDEYHEADERVRIKKRKLKAKENNTNKDKGKKSKGIEVKKISGNKKEINKGNSKRNGVIKKKGTIPKK